MSDNNSTSRGATPSRNQSAIISTAAAELAVGTNDIARGDFIPRRIDFAQAFGRVEAVIRRLQALSERKRHGADHEKFLTTDAHRFINAAGTLITAVESRYHKENHGLPITEARKIYNRIKEHCQEARRLENIMTREDVGDSQKLRADMGFNDVWITELSPYQLEQISAKTMQLLDHTRSAAVLFEEYREATLKHAEERRTALAADLEHIQRGVNVAVGVIDSVTRFIGAFVPSVQVSTAAAAGS